MRLVSWNCHGGFAKKHAALLSLEPDLAVICEAREADTAALAGSEFVWTGNPGAKGLAILARNGWRLERLGEGSGPFVLAARASRADTTVTLVGVWTHTVRGSYIRPLMTALDELGSCLTGDVLMAGDFNANPVFRTNPSFEEARLRLASHDLESLWHARSGETLGAEQTPTHYWMWKQARPFHLDYVFATGRLRARCRDMQIGRFEDWVARRVSDHMPLIADFTPD